MVMSEAIPTTITIDEYLKLTKRAKYGNEKVSEDDYTFDSIAELTRYRELKLLAQAGQITLLRVHPSYELQPAFVDRDGKRQRAICYEADFSYVERGDRIVEDVKGGKATQTAAYKMKAKMFRYRYSALIYRVIER